MRDVRVVPKFSYPVYSARWKDKKDLAEWERDKGLKGDAGGEEDFDLLYHKSSAVSKGHGGDKDGGENFDWLELDASPIRLESGWAEAEDDMKQLLHFETESESESEMAILQPEPQKVVLHQMLSEVNPKFAVQADRTVMCGFD